MPIVSIIVPCYNEQRTIRLLLEAVAAQTYPRGETEVVVADGLSTDDTRAEIARFQAETPGLEVHIVDNPRQNIPSGLNRALEAARGEIILRLDAHSAPHPEYVARCVAALEAGLGDNVGGVWEITPGGPGWAARAIAAAAAHPLGVGDAAYRHTATAQYVDTVPFGAFRRALVERVGAFDETLLSNEDYEFNARIRQAGGRIWLDPAIRSRYFARATFGGLARQYLRYGYWKARMLRRYPATIRWRQAGPPVFVLSLAGLAALGFWQPAFWRLLGLEAALYGLILLAFGARAAHLKRDPALLFGLPPAIATMHLGWGAALLWGLLRPSPKP